MGLLDDLLGGASGKPGPQGGGLSKPLVLALLALLASGFLGRKGAPDAAPSGGPAQPNPSASDNPLGDLLGGLLRGGGPQTGGGVPGPGAPSGAPGSDPLGDLLGGLLRGGGPQAGGAPGRGAPGGAPGDNPLGDLLGGLLRGGGPQAGGAPGRGAPGGGAPGDNPLGDLLGGLLRGGGGPQPGGAPGNNPLGDLLGGLLGGGASKNVPGGSAAGGALAGGLLGGLGSLLNQFQQSGQGDVIDSWIGGGQNRQISPSQLGAVLDPDVIRQLSEQTGVDQGDLLSQISEGLPGLIDQLTPQGRLPSTDDFSFEELSRLSERLR